MGTVVWHVTMSLDGFIAAPDDAMDWVFESWAGPNETANEVIATTGAILMGRRTYEVEDRTARGSTAAPGRAPTSCSRTSRRTTCPTG